MAYLPSLRMAGTLLRTARVPCIPLLRGFPRFCYSTSAKNTEKVIAKTPSTADTAGAFEASQGLGHLTKHRVNKLERYLLVWGGNYKTLAEVPSFVGQDTMERARNKARIKINLMMVAAAIFGCILMIMSGKRARERGESVAIMNQEWHRKINTEASQQATATASANKAE